MSRLQLTPFGPWLDVTMTDGHPMLVHMFLQREVTVRKADRDVMYFDVYGRHMKFGSAEFCLLTGLRFGVAPPLPSLATVEFVGRIWPGTNPEDVKINMVVERFTHGLGQYSDDDIIRLCIMLMVESMFMGRELYSFVSETVIRAVEDLDTCSSFPWGSYIWAHAFKQLHNAIVRRKDHHSKMTLSGFVYAFKIWIVEMLPVAQQNFILRNDRVIRGTRWDRKAATNRSTWLAFFNSVNMSIPQPSSIPTRHTQAAPETFATTLTFTPQFQTSGADYYIPQRATSYNMSSYVTPGSSGYMQNPIHQTQLGSGLMDQRDMAEKQERQLEKEQLVAQRKRELKELEARIAFVQQEISKEEITVREIKENYTGLEQMINEKSEQIIRCQERYPH